jgi:nitroimidazol reductase NimA-like FMN-containing flavoprotein (pyridoxamine 5'-phosphate oxidase superfamily)
MLDWNDAERILRGGRYYWIATTDADGGPHLVQQWGAWIGEHLYFEGSERTRWARNLERDPRVGFGTQSGTRAVFGQGTVDVVRGVEPPVAKRIASQYTAKYGKTFDYRPKPEQYEKGPVFRARPSKLIVFDVKHFNTSATRFTF